MAPRRIQARKGGKKTNISTPAPIPSPNPDVLSTMGSHTLFQRLWFPTEADEVMDRLHGVAEVILFSYANNNIREVGKATICYDDTTGKSRGILHGHVIKMEVRGLSLSEMCA